MTRIKSNAPNYQNGVGPLDSATFHWMNTDEGESCLKADIEENWSRFMELSCNEVEIHPEPSPIRRRNTLIRHWVTAASVIAVMLLAGTLLYIADRGANSPETEITPTTDNDVRLILSDGEHIVLNGEMEKRLIATQGGVDLVQENGVLLHKRTSQESSRTAQSRSGSEVQWGSLEVPRGNQFSLVLEDGTRVWLNADSRIRFPLEFNDRERCVYVEGEAFFDVAPNADIPFIVQTAEQKIRVLGTRFNVYAYPQGEKEHTTLLGGSVSVESNDNPDRIILLPGEQAILERDTKIYTVQKINAQDAAAWRDGIFVLNGNKLEEVFFKLSRWYDFEYVFDNERLNGLTFSGNLPRFEDVDTIFEVIEMIANIEIKVTGNQVEVTDAE